MLLGRYENTEKRKAQVAEKGILYMGMGVSGGEEGARNGEGSMAMIITCTAASALHICLAPQNG